jgi:hypothetical protein
MQRLLQFDMIRMQTGNGEDGGLCAGEENRNRLLGLAL